MATNAIISLRRISTSQTAYIQSEIKCECHGIQLLISVINGQKLPPYCPACLREELREAHN